MVAETPADQALADADQERARRSLCRRGAVGARGTSRLRMAAREQAVDGCPAQPPSSCVVSVEDTSTAVVTALLALGGASFLIGLIGVRFTTIKAGQVELGGTASEQKPEDVQKEVEAGNLESVEPAAAAAAADADVWSTLPRWVRSALYRWVADNPVIELPVNEAVTAAYKPAGQGNYAWSIQLRAADGERTLRVSQGKGSTQATLD